MATKNIHLQIEQFGTLKLLYVVASKLSRNSLEEFMGAVIVNKEMDSDILGRLRDAVRRKRLKKCITNISFVLQNNAPAHLSV
jgi:hypothetical protein